MKRKALGDLVDWYKRDKRKPLVLRGARQVGKSTLVRQFAEAQGLQLLEINLEKVKILSASGQQMDINAILQEVESICNQSLDPQKALLFFDEIQEQLELFAALRYFYEERPEIAVIAAGSLLETALKNSEHSVPVGRIEYYYLGPMSFSEFLQALDERKLIEHLQRPLSSFIESVHARLLRRFNEFLYVGGMPEAVETYVRTSSPIEVRRVQSAILQTYQDDFGKYSKHVQIDRVRRVFNFVPGHLGQKLKYAEIDREEKARDLKAALELLILARVVTPVYHTNATALPLKSQKDDSVMKLYFLDVGLVSCMQEVDWNLVREFGVNVLTKGGVVEQYVAQHLLYRDGGFAAPELFYWLRDKKAQNAEVDFILSIDGHIVPLEVKAGHGGRIKSLQVFMKEKGLPVAVLMDSNFLRSELMDKKINSSGDNVIFEIKGIPYYLVESINEIYRA